MIPPVHLPAHGQRESTSFRANPLATLRSGKPSTGSARCTPAAGAVDSLVAHTNDPQQLRIIAMWLNVERSARYQPEPGRTFCNVYAYDFCYLSGVYLPRVWWNGTAIAEMKTRTVVPKYGVTIGEMNANALHLWLQAYGEQFGWLPTTLEFAQKYANGGAVVVITGLRADRARSGHISVVLPEGPEAAVISNGVCTIPVQSQAGVKNYCASTKPGRWWDSNEFSAHGLWVNLKH